MSMFIKHTLIGTFLILFIMIVYGCTITHIPEPPIYDPVVFETGETIAVNNDGWKLKKYSRKLESGHEVISYEMLDPVLKRWCPAVAYQDSEVIMSDHGKELWRKDRMALVEERRFEALPKKHEVERDEEIDIDGACFDSKTRVLMADGGPQEISDIKEGQLVKSYNIEKGTVDDKRVTKTYVFQTEGYYLINRELKAKLKTSSSWRGTKTY